MAEGTHPHDEQTDPGTNSGDFLASPLQGASSEARTSDLDSPASLPPAKDHARLRLATLEMVESKVSLNDAAFHHGVDPDTLHVFYRTYVNFVGRENVPDAHNSYASTELRKFDRSDHRQFDRNWAEMMHRARLNQPQLSPSRRWLVDSTLTSWMFNGHILDKIVVAGAACVIALGFLVFKGTRDDSEPKPPPPTQPSHWEPKEGLDGLGRNQQIDLLDQILAALSVFIEAETWQERLPLVREPNEVASMMELHYKTHRDGPITPIVVDPDIAFIDRPDGKFALVQATQTKPNADDKDLIFLIEIATADSEFLIDWKVLVNYEPISWETFKAAKSTEPSPFRVKVSSGDYYNHPFMDETQFISLRLSFLHRPNEIVYGFARRESEIAKNLQSSLEGELDRVRAVVLNLRFPNEAKFDNVLEIESIVADRW